MNMKIFATAASAALLVGAAQASAAVINIDTFDTDQEVQDLPGGGISNSLGTAAPEAIGGYRYMEVKTDNGRKGATSLVVSPDVDDPSDGVLSFNNDSGVIGSGSVVYDANGAGLGGLDLYDGPAGGFLFDVIRVDAELYIKISAFDTNGQQTNFSGSVVTGGTPFAPFAAFSNSGFDWNSVNNLSFFAQSGPGVPSLDGSISSISVETGVVPLPASALLLLGGLGGLSAFGARRKRS